MEEVLINILSWKPEILAIAILYMLIFKMACVYMCVYFHAHVLMLWLIHQQKSWEPNNKGIVNMMECPQERILRQKTFPGLFFFLPVQEKAYKMLLETATIYCQARC